MTEWGKSKETLQNLLQWCVYPWRNLHDSLGQNPTLRGDTTDCTRFSYDHAKFRKLLTVITRLFMYEVRVLRNATAPIRGEYQARCSVWNLRVAAYRRCPCAKRPFFPPTTRRSDITKEVPISSPEAPYVMTFPLTLSGWQQCPMPSVWKWICSSSQEVTGYNTNFISRWRIPYIWDVTPCRRLETQRFGGT